MAEGDTIFTLENVAATETILRDFIQHLTSTPPLEALKKAVERINAIAGFNGIMGDFIDLAMDVADAQPPEPQVVLPDHYREAFLTMIQGACATTWHAWWRANSDRAARELPRLDFLRLKFNALAGAAALLDADNVPYIWSAQGRQRLAWSRLDASFVDQDGRPLKKRRAEIYEGALSHLARGDVEHGRTILREIVARTLRSGSSVRQSQALGEMVLDAEQFASEGDKVTAGAIASAVAQVAEEDDLVAPAVRHARALLQRLTSG